MPQRGQSRHPAPWRPRPVPPLWLTLTSNPNQAARAQAQGALAMVVLRLEPRGRAPTAPLARRTAERLVLPVDAWTTIPCVVVCGPHALALSERMRNSRTSRTSPPLLLHMGPPALLSPAARHAASRSAALAAIAAPPRPSTADELPPWLAGPPYQPLPVPLPLGATDWMVQVPMPEPSAQPAPRAAPSASCYWGRPTTAAGLAAVRKAERTQAQMHAQMHAQSGEEEGAWGAEGSLREDLDAQPAAVRSEASAAAARQREGLSIFADARAPLPESRRVPFGPGF